MTTTNPSAAGASRAQRTAPGPTLVYHHRTQGVDAQGIHVHEMCRAFEKIGCTVVKTSLYSEEAVGSESRPGLLGRVVGALPPLAYEMLELGYNVVGAARLVAAVRRHRPAFLYERYSLFNLSGLIASKLTGVPLVLEVNSPLAYEKSRYGRLFLKGLARRIETYLVNHAHRTVAVTGVLRGMLVADGARPEKIVVMHNCVNPEEYGRPAPGKPDGAPAVAAFVGWFRDWHGVGGMIEALDEAGLFAAGKVRLLLVGDGPARPELEAVVRRRGLEGAVEITGARSRAELFELLPGVDIALQPAATSYASPMKLFEYMAAGKAVVAPDQPNIREIVADGESGLLFAPGDWNGLAAAVARLCDDPELRGRLGRGAERFVAEDGRVWTENARRVLELARR